MPPPIVNGTDASDRYLTHVSTDKPIYRTGEKVYVRAVVLQAISHYPMTNPGTASFEVKGPKGDTVASGAAVCGELEQPTNKRARSTSNTIGSFLNILILF